MGFLFAGGRKEGYLPFFFMAGDVLTSLLLRSILPVHMMRTTAVMSSSAHPGPDFTGGKAAFTRPGTYYFDFKTGGRGQSAAPGSPVSNNIPFFPVEVFEEDIFIINCFNYFSCKQAPVRGHPGHPAPETDTPVKRQCIFKHGFHSP